MNDQFTVGDLNTITIPDPAAGANFSYTLPVGRRLHVHSISFHVLTDANAANRKPIIYVVDATVITYISISRPNHAASIGISYCFSASASDPVAIIDAYSQAPISPFMWLKPGDILNSDLILIQVGDQISDIRIVAESFLLP